MSDGDLERLIDHVAANPLIGDVLPGTGGARKLRWKATGRGKRGGVRVITFYSGNDLPVFLLSCFAKNEKINLNAAERNDLKKILSDLATVYVSSVKRQAHDQGRRKNS